MQPTARLGPPVKALESVPSLIFHLHGGSWANRKQKAVIQFYCGRDAEEVSSETIWLYLNLISFLSSHRNLNFRGPGMGHTRLHGLLGTHVLVNLQEHPLLVNQTLTTLKNLPTIPSRTKIRSFKMIPLDPH